MNNGHRHHQPNSNSVPPLAIRRHTPGSTDPTLQQLSSRNHSPTSNAPIPVRQNPPQPNSSSLSVRNHSSTSNTSFTVKRNPSRPNPSSLSARNHSSAASLDPDERPIKPMRDTSVYNKPSTKKKFIQPKKPSPPTPQPKKPSPPTPQPIQPSSRYEANSFRSSSSSSRNQINNALQRRPIRIDLIPKTSFGIPPQRNRSRPIVVEEYDEEDDYPVSYVEHVPKKVISYREVSGMTTREWENYQMSKAQRIVRIRSPPVETIIYRT